MVCDNSNIHEIEEEVIFKEIGSGFEKESSLLKTYARKGQAFSTTKFIQKVPPELITEIDDIYRTSIVKEELTGVEEEQTFNFTDGCGNISTDFGDIIKKVYGLKECSAYQFRMGGCKGVLMVR